MNRRAHTRQDSLLEGARKRQGLRRQSARQAHTEHTAGAPAAPLIYSIAPVYPQALPISPAYLLPRPGPPWRHAIFTLRPCSTGLCSGSGSGSGCAACHVPSRPCLGLCLCLGLGPWPCPCPCPCLPCPANRFQAAEHCVSARDKLDQDTLALEGERLDAPGSEDAQAALPRLRCCCCCLTISFSGPCSFSFSYHLSSFVF